MERERVPRQLDALWDERSSHNRKDMQPEQLGKSSQTRVYGGEAVVSIVERPGRGGANERQKGGAIVSMMAIRFSRTTVD